MNWHKIKDECPKAWEEFDSWMEEKDVDRYLVRLDGDLIVPHSERSAFEFFDEKGIGITVSVLMGNQYDYTITLDAGINRHYSKEGAQDERDTCEEFAFTKAFEILEQQLSNQQSGE